MNKNRFARINFEKMKLNFSLYGIPIILLVFLIFFHKKTTGQNHNSQNHISVTTKSNNTEKTITLNIDEFEKSLEKLGKEIEKFVEEVENSGIEIIEVSEENGQTVLTITKTENKTKEITILKGLDADKYLAEKKKEAKANLNFESSGNFGLTYHNAQGETKEIDIKLNELFENLGLVVAEEKKNHRKIIIIENKSKNSL